MVDYELDIRALIDANEAERIHVPVVACGVGADPKRAADAIRAGAMEFIPLPPEADLIAAVLAAVADDDRPLVTQDPSMIAVLKLADQVAASEASILITGESGVGKEVMARYVHAKSRRAQRPFISVNCAAIPENLLESELFGHEKGAYRHGGPPRGQVRRSRRRHAAARRNQRDGRTVAGEIRWCALQERVIDRVGGSKPVTVNIRVIATSNRDLGNAVRDGRFREDLLYRLNVVNLKLPPLRERPCDIIVLCDHFVRKYAKANGVPQRPLSAEARRRLQGHSWPGNVRELENAMHRAVLLAVGAEIDETAVRLPDGQPLLAANASGGYAAQAAQAADAAARAFVGQTVAQMEQALILETLTHCLGNRTHAANILGISIRTLRNKLNEYSAAGMSVPAPQSGLSAA